MPTLIKKNNNYNIFIIFVQYLIKWRHFHGEVIMQCVRWYCKYGISYRDLEEMMAERGLEIDHTTMYRWVQHYAQELKKRLEWYKRRYSSGWLLEETYIR